MGGQNVNGELTLGENIADLGGLATAYDALQKASAGKEDPMVEGSSRDQRFFYGWAEVGSRRSVTRPQSSRSTICTARPSSGLWSAAQPHAWARRPSASARTAT